MRHHSLQKKKELVMNTTEFHVPDNNEHLQIDTRGQVAGEVYTNDMLR